MQSDKSVVSEYEKDYDKYAPEFTKGVILPEGWKWECYPDISGCLRSPDGEEYLEYDYSTNEITDEDGDWIRPIPDAPGIMRLLYTRILPKRRMEAEKSRLKLIGGDFTLELNTPINIPEFTASPGGYYLKDRYGNTFGFDFYESEVRAKDPYHIEFEVSDPDPFAFPEMKYLPYWLKEIAEFPEVYFSSEPDAEVAGIESFTLFLKEEKKEEGNHPFTDTPYMTFDQQEDGLIRCQFTRKLLDTCTSFPEA